MSDEEKPDAAPVRFPPPLVPIIALVVAFLVQALLGPLATAPTGGLRFGIGALLAAAGAWLIVSAFGLFRETGQDPAPWETSPELIAKGLYRWTRNPMYLGMGLLQAGLGVLFANLWAVVLVPVTWFAIYRIAIRHEEAYLERTFGSAYRDYCSQVRRWI